MKRERDSVFSEGLRKLLDKGLRLLCSPFDELRANGSDAEIVKDFPFVLSLSKHGFALCVIRLTVFGEPLSEDALVKPF